MSTTTKVLEALKNQPGVPVGAKSLLHLGSRAAVDQALSRLCRRGEIERVARGVYLCPESTRFGPKLPALSEFLASQGTRLGQSIVPSEWAEASRLGLTLQVPARQVWLSEKSRKLKWGKQLVELRKAPRGLLYPESHGGHVLRALAWAGNVANEETLSKLARGLSREQKENLAALRPQLSTEQASIVSRLCA